MSTVNPRYSLPLSKYKRKPASLPLSEQYLLNALSFDGVNDYVSVPVTTGSSILTITSEVTMVCVVKLTENADCNLVSLRYGYLLGYTTKHSYELFIREADGTLASTRYAAIEFEVNPLDWHVVTGVYDGEYLKNYVDGKLFKEKYVGSITLSAPTTCKVGCNYAANGTFTKGIIHSVLLYNRALSEDEHKQLAKNPYHPPLSGCVLWLSAESIDENAGVWRDQSGNGNNGTIFGAKKVKLQQYEVSL